MKFPKLRNSNNLKSFFILKRLAKTKRKTFIKSYSNSLSRRALKCSYGFKGKYRLTNNMKSATYSFLFNTMSFFLFSSTFKRLFYSFIKNKSLFSYKGIYHSLNLNKFFDKIIYLKSRWPRYYEKKKMKQQYPLNFSFKGTIFVNLYFFWFLVLYCKFVKNFMRVKFEIWVFSIFILLKDFFFGFRNFLISPFFSVWYKKQKGFPNKVFFMDLNHVLNLNYYPALFNFNYNSKFFFRGIRAKPGKKFRGRWMRLKWGFRKWVFFF